jgi:metal-responsive CopG/Arc/MetJ family transcriptional regulator
MPKKVLIALTPAMLEQIDIIAFSEHRTRSDLIREALRRYMDTFKRTNLYAIQPSAQGLLENTVNDI